MREGLEEGNFEIMVQIGRENPKTLAELLQDPLLFGEIIQAAKNPALRWLAASFLYDMQKNLSEEQKAIARDILIRILMQLAAQISAKGIRSTKRRLTTFKPGLEEVEIEATMENCVGKKCPDYEDIIMVDKEPKEREVVMMLDTSNSMQREKILIATLAIGVLAYHLRGEKYAILTFNEEVNVVKSMEQEMTMEALLDKMLEIQSRGVTDIKLCLEKGLQELSRKVANERLGIIATDGWATRGGDPFEVASKFSKLHVLQVPIGIGGGDSDTCIAMAKAAKGRRVYVEHYLELPRAILEVLR